MGLFGVKWWIWGSAIAFLALVSELGKQYGWDKDSVLEMLRVLSERLGIWMIPLYVVIHTLTLAFCLPYAVFFEAGASMLFGFLTGVVCVFFAKILAASVSFWIGRALFGSSRTAMDWAHRSKYFHILSKGVERDGWRFVLLARFSPIPSYVINYALAATNVGFLVDFLLPTVIGCLPMILQNTSIGSLASLAVASTSAESRKSQVLSYLFPLLGIVSSILISLRIKKYSSEITSDMETKPSEPLSDNSHVCRDNADTSHISVGRQNELKKRNS